MGRARRRFEWEKILGKKLWCASELAPILGISPLNTRRYLRRGFFGRRLIRKKFGRIFYYGVRLFTRPPINTSECPDDTSGLHETFEGRCGCKFVLCSINPKHSTYAYCNRHVGLHPKRKRPRVDSTYVPETPQQVTPRRIVGEFEEIGE